jgi:hypothetical protein
MASNADEYQGNNVMCLCAFTCREPRRVTNQDQVVAYIYFSTNNSGISSLLLLLSNMSDNNIKVYVKKIEKNLPQLY